MPLDFGVPDLFVNEYGRLTDSLTDLKDGGVQRAVGELARRRPGEVIPRAITIPGWDDVLHVVPRPVITPEMRAAYYAAKRLGRPSGLHVDLVDEIERRAARARQIAASPTPRYAQAYGQAMTAIDNVQDLLTTVVVAGRLSLNPLIRIVDQIGVRVAGETPAAARGRLLAEAASRVRTERAIAQYVAEARLVLRAAEAATPLRSFPVSIATLEARRLAQGVPALTLESLLASQARSRALLGSTGVARAAAEAAELALDRAIASGVAPIRIPAAGAQSASLASEATRGFFAGATRATIDAEAAILARQVAGRGTLRTVAGLGLRTVGRLLGPLGWILTVADLLKLITMIGLWAAPFYGVWCTRSLSGAALGIPAMLFGGALCAKLVTYNRSNPFGYKARLKRSVVLRSWRPSIYNLMEVAQTTDALFGVGVSFGAIVGVISDASFSLELAARGEAPRFDAGPAFERMYQTLKPTTEGIPTVAMQVYRAAAAVLGSGVTLHGVQDTFTIEEHVEALAATSIALSVLRPMIEHPAMVEAVNLALDTPLPPPSYGRERVRGELVEAGVDPATQARWPLPGAPLAITGEQLMATATPLINEALKELVAPRRDDPAGVCVGAIVKRIIDRTCLLMTGHPDAMDFEPLPEYQILESLAMEDRLINAASSEDAVVSYFHALAEWKLAHDSRSVPLAVLDEYARRWDVDLLRLLPPETPVPPGLLAPRFNA
jgi:hypothetical protein